MITHLYQCSSDADRTAWGVACLKKGGVLDDLFLWLAGIDRPMRLIASVKAELRSQGIAVSKTIRKVRDAAGDPHDVLTWYIAPTSTPGDAQ